MKTTFERHDLVLCAAVQTDLHNDLFFYPQGPSPQPRANFRRKAAGVACLKSLVLILSFFVSLFCC